MARPLDQWQISGVGGSLDYVEAAALAEDGVSIIALPSTTEDGKRSKIVASLAPGAVVTTPRFCTDYIVTEYGNRPHERQRPPRAGRSPHPHRSSGFFGMHWRNS